MRKSEHDKIATRLALILTRLNAGERLDPQELAGEYGVSIRTIQRDLNDRFSYLPIKKIGAHYQLEPYALGRLSFNDIKNFAALSGVRGLFPALDNRFIAELLDSRINAAYLIKNNEYENIKPQSAAFETLTRAVLEKQTIGFRYHEKPRQANPYKLINNGGVWYLLADEAGKLKHFALSKIADLSLQKSHFKPDPKIAAILNENRQNWFSENRIEVVLEVSAQAAPYFLRRKLLPDQRTIDQTPETLTLATTVSFTEEILRIVRYWMPHLRIVSPENLRESLRRELEEYMRMV